MKNTDGLESKKQTQIGFLIIIIYIFYILLEKLLFK